MHEPTGRKPIVAVVGDARLPSGAPLLLVARYCGRRLVDAGYRVLTGGLGGVMRAASEGARSSPSYSSGAVIGLLPGNDPGAANEFVDIAIPTGLDIARNCLVANSDALIAIGGGAGTLSEIAMAWQLHRLIIGIRGSGWSGELADRRIDHRTRYPDISDDRVYGADSAEEAVGLIRELLPRYSRRHRGVPSSTGE
jgi:uncharacterized protein (TIGR00725 family)